MKQSIINSAAKALKRLIFALLLFTISGQFMNATASIQLLSPSFGQTITFPATFTWSVSEPVDRPFVFQLRTYYNGAVLYQQSTESTSITVDYAENFITMNDSLYWDVILEGDEFVPYQNQIRENAIYQDNTPKVQLTYPCWINNLNPTGINFTWQNYEGAQSYQILISKAQNYPAVEERITVNTNSYEFRNEYFEPNTWYIWRVGAISTDGTITALNTMSNRSSFSTGDYTSIDTMSLYNPDYATQSVNREQVNFQWRAMGNVTGYRIQVSTNEDFSDLLVNELITTNSYTMNALAPDTKYYWKVRTIRENETSELWSTTWWFYTDGNPIIITAERPYLGQENFDAQINTFLWTSIPNAIEYQVVFNELGTNEYVSYYFTENEVLMSFLKPNTRYGWRIRGKYYDEDNQIRFTDWSLNFGLKTKAEFGVPPALINPTNGAAVDNTTSVAFLWEQIPDVTNYELQISENYDFVNPIVNINSETNTYDFENPATERYYYWRVRSNYVINDNISAQSNWSSIHIFSVQSPDPGRVSLIAPSFFEENMPSTINFQWNSQIDLGSFILQVCPDSTFLESNLILNTEVNGTTYELSGLLSDAWYSWRVKGNNPDYPNAPWTYSFFKTGNTGYGIAPLEPANGITVESSIVEVSWNAVDAAQAYRFQLSSTDGTNKKLTLKNDETLMGASAVMVKDTLVKDNKITLNLDGINKTYYWRSCAKLSDTDSSCWTPMWSFNSDEESSVVTVNTIISAKVTPSIATQNIILSIDTKTEEMTSINIYNSNGELVNDYGVIMINGSFEKPISITELNNGKYYIAIQVKNQTMTLPFIVIK